MRASRSRRRYEVPETENTSSGGGDGAGIATERARRRRDDTVSSKHVGSAGAGETQRRDSTRVSRRANWQ